MAINPCFKGVSLQRGAQIIALLGIIIFVGDIPLKVHEQFYKHGYDKPLVWWKFVLTLFVDFSGVGICFLLLLGSIQRNYKYCKISLIFGTDLLLTKVSVTIWYLVDIKEESDKTLERVTYGLAIPFAVLFTSYTFFVVHCFMEEIKRESNGSPPDVNEVQQQPNNNQDLEKQGKDADDPLPVPTIDIITI